MNARTTLFALLVLAGMTVAGFTMLRTFSAAQGAEAGRDPALAAFAAVGPIDAHAHIYKDDPAFKTLFERLNLRILNICVVDDRDPYYKSLKSQRDDLLKVRHTTDGRAVLCTTFSPYDFESAGYADRTMRELGRDFDGGAVAVKVYKVMGMEMKSKAGKWVMVDDPAFEPIYEYIAKRNRTLVAHLAEPDSCWQPPNPASPDYEYYKEHPEEYAYMHPDWPSKAAILAARDHLVAENPKLRVVGAHLGSMESDVDQMAERFDRYPNFAVDTAARVPYFILQPRDKVRAFLIKYQDRILYATDQVVMPTDTTDERIKEWTDTFARDWRFFATNQTIEYNGHTYQGLELPAPVLSKIFRVNALNWFPGILGVRH
jgi:predicted TIM-barrel fold metal-dependent hydrolase